MERGYRYATRTLGVVTAVLGVAILAVSLAGGGGPLAVGVIVGLAFMFVGGARVYLATRSERS